MSRRPHPPLRSASNDSAVLPLGSPPLQPRRSSATKPHQHARGASSSAAADVIDLARLTDYLALDARPTFVLPGPGKQADRAKPVFINPALHHAAALLTLIQTTLKGLSDIIGSPGADSRLKDGATAGSSLRRSRSGLTSKSSRPSKIDEEPVLSQPSHTSHPTLRNTFEQDGFATFLLPSRGATANTTIRWRSRSWRRVILPSGWVVVHCESFIDPVLDENEELKQRESPQIESEKEPEGAVADWMLDHSVAPNAWVQFLCDFDWSDTPFGPLAQWPWELRTWVHMLMSDPFPGVILWGSDLTLLYNYACMQLFIERHPAAMGGDPRLVFGDVWVYMKDMIDRVRTTGRTVEHHNLPLPIRRHGRIEETFWSIAIMPILGSDGRVRAIYDRFHETTSFNIAERRQKTLAQLSEVGGQARTLTELWKKILHAIEINTETPYAIAYSVSNIDGSGKASSERQIIHTEPRSTKKACELEGTMGVPDEHDRIPGKLQLSKSQLSSSEHELTPYLRQAWQTNEPVLMSKDDGTLPSCLEIKNSNRGFSDEFTRAVVFPVRFVVEDRLAAFIIHALNPRRPYDSDYKGYIALMQTRIRELAANIFLPEEDRRTQAALREETLRQAALASRLLSKTHEAEQKQMRFMRLAENAPIGMVMYDAEGKPLFYNDAYFELFGLRQEKYTTTSWLEAIHPEDRGRVQREWRKLIEEGIPVTVEHRVTKPWRSINPVTGKEVIGETWLLSSAFPEITAIDMSGPPQIMGWLIDISHQKWAEKLQQQRLEDALENKRQSENFIDMTSHEMRNPLSAILQSADGINTAIAAAMVDQPASVAESESSGHLQAIAENARNIVLCAQHQKRIVDDILTLSKLDSNLLLITPDEADPVEIVRHVLKMYEAELANSSISVSVSIDESYKTLDVTTVLLDPSRLLQILINLMTNAIKFTQFQPRRKIVILLSASSETPTDGPNDVKFFPANLSRTKISSTHNNNTSSETLYLSFAVQDSGPGMTESEHKMLFHRFQQANERTHVQYGGSGLGLFISRELTELQGGQIGVASSPGHGSTFAFYIECKKYNGKPDAIEESGLLTPHGSAYNPPLSTPGLPRNPVIDLPISPVTSPTLEAANAFDRLTAKTSNEKIEVPGTESPLHILVVEDNLMNQRVMAKQLRRAGCVVHVANHGSEALEFMWRTNLVVVEPSDSVGDISTDTVQTTSKIPSRAAGARSISRQNSADLPLRNRETPKLTEQVSLDVILMDVEMPIMDGLTCVREIRSLQRARKLRRHVPIICITANARDAQIDEAQGAGCDLVVTKPFRIPELLPQMRRLVSELKEKE